MQNSDLFKKILVKKKQDNLEKFLLMCLNPDLVVPPSFEKAAIDTINEMNRIDEAMRKLKQEERNINRFLNNLMQNDNDFFEKIADLQRQVNALAAKTATTPPTQPQPAQSANTTPPTQPQPAQSTSSPFKPLS